MSPVPSSILRKNPLCVFIYVITKPRPCQTNRAAKKQKGGAVFGRRLSVAEKEGFEPVLSLQKPQYIVCFSYKKYYILYFEKVCPKCAPNLKSRLIVKSPRGEILGGFLQTILYSLRFH